jgi:hypothetical protein
MEYEWLAQKKDPSVTFFTEGLAIHSAHDGE